MPEETPEDSVEPTSELGTASKSSKAKKAKGVRFWIALFLLLGIGFCAYYLYQSDQLYIPEKIDWSFFLFGVFIAFLGHIADGASWRLTLRGIAEPVSLRICISATAFAVLGKYIPGKIWMLAGRVLYLHRYAGVSAAKATSAVMFLQLTMLWMGLALGLLFSPFASLRAEILWLSIAFLVCGALVLGCWGSLKGVLSRRISFFEKVPVLPLPALTVVSLCTLLTWSLWSLGFVICARAIYCEALPLAALGVFPLAAVLGILAIVLPGGLGVREGIIVATLVTSGMALEVASTLAILSRVWFFASELLFALFGLLLHLGGSKKPARGSEKATG